MKISQAEQLAIAKVLSYGKGFGYGNLICHLQTAWARKLMRNGLDEMTAREATARDGSGYPFAMQDDLVQRGEWDETGARYRPSPDAATHAVARAVDDDDEEN